LTRSFEQQDVGRVRRRRRHRRDRRAAEYVDRILHGAKAGDIPVEQPTKFVLALNSTTAKALGLAVPTTLLAIVDEAIE